MVKRYRGKGEVEGRSISEERVGLAVIILRLQDKARLERNPKTGTFVFDVAGTPIASDVASHSRTEKKFHGHLYLIPTISSPYTNVN